MKEWSALLIKPETLMNEAIATLDKGAQRIALVVDAHHRLLGTVTDGDIRRALIRHVSLESPVQQLMCTTPKTAKAEWTKDQVLSVMEKHQLLQLPIVDAQNRVIGLHTLHELLKAKHRDNPVFIMAGGFGSRLHPLTKDCPKPLLKVGNTPILERILRRFIDAGFHRFYISTHYKHDMIAAYFRQGEHLGVSIEYIYEEKPLGTAGALGLLPHEDIQLPLLVMNADLLTNVNFEGLLSFYQAHPSVATMCVRNYEHCVPYGTVESQGHRITSLVEKPSLRFFINAGIYLLSPELVHSVKPGVSLDMPTLLEQQIRAGKEVTLFPIHEYWLDIGRMEDFQLAQEYAS